MRMRGLRKITVDDIVYRWKADWTYPAGVRTLHLRVWGGDKTNQALHANLTTDWSGFAEAMKAARERGETPYEGVIDCSFVMPRDVRAIIGYGLAHGWNPSARGGPFVVTPADTPLPEGLSLATANTVSTNQG